MSQKQSKSATWRIVATKRCVAHAADAIAESKISEAKLARDLKIGRDTVRRIKAKLAVSAESVDAVLEYLSKL